MKLSSKTALGSLFLLASSPSEAGKVRDPNTAEMAALSECIQTKGTEGNLAVLSQESKKVAESYIWNLTKKEIGEELRLQAELQSGSKNGVTQTLLLGQDLDMNGILDGNGMGKPVVPEEQAFFTRAVNETLKVCKTSQDSEQNICPGAWTLSKNEIFELAENSVQKVVALTLENGRLSCTGSVLEGDRILTANHCIKEGEKLRIAIPQDLAVTEVKLVPGTVIAQDKYRDMALLQIPLGSTDQYFTVANSSGTDKMAYSIGHGDEYGWVVSTFPRPKPSGDAMFDAGDRNFAFPPSFCSAPGASGSPLLNKEGELTGVFKQLGAAPDFYWSSVFTSAEQVNTFLQNAEDSTVTFPTGEIKTCKVAFGKENLILKPEGRYTAKKYVVDEYCQ